jgi:hypothetical protein
MGGRHKGVDYCPFPGGEMELGAGTRARCLFLRFGNFQRGIAFCNGLDFRGANKSKKKLDNA